MFGEMDLARPSSFNFHTNREYEVHESTLGSTSEQIKLFAIIALNSCHEQYIDVQELLSLGVIVYTRLII